MRIPAEINLVHFEEVYQIAEDSGAAKLTHSILDLKSLPDSYMVAVNALIKEKSQVVYSVHKWRGSWFLVWVVPSLVRQN